MSDTHYSVFSMPIDEFASVGGLIFGDNFFISGFSFCALTLVGIFPAIWFNNLLYVEKEYIIEVNWIENNLYVMLQIHIYYRSHNASYHQ
jgi:hypothetical protein